MDSPPERTVTITFNKPGPLGMTIGSPDALDRVWQASRKYDADGDNRLDRQEITQALVGLGRPASSEDVEAAFQQMDSDLDGTVHIKEFEKWYKAQWRATNSDEDKLPCRVDDVTGYAVSKGVKIGSHVLMVEGQDKVRHDVRDATLREVQVLLRDAGRPVKITFVPAEADVIEYSSPQGRLHRERKAMAVEPHRENRSVIRQRRSPAKMAPGDGGVGQTNPTGQRVSPATLRLARLARQKVSSPPTARRAVRSPAREERVARARERARRQRSPIMAGGDLRTLSQDKTPNGVGQDNVRASMDSLAADPRSATRSSVSVGRTKPTGLQLSPSPRRAVRSPAREKRVARARERARGKRSPIAAGGDLRKEIERTRLLLEGPVAATRIQAVFRGRRGRQQAEAVIEAQWQQMQLNQQRDTVFKRLADPAQFTESYRHRFSEQGREPPGVAARKNTPPSGVTSVKRDPVTMHLVPQVAGTVYDRLYSPRAQNAARTNDRFGISQEHDVEPSGGDRSLYVERQLTDNSVGGKTTVETTRYGDFEFSSQETDDRDSGDVNQSPPPLEMSLVWPMLISS